MRECDAPAVAGDRVLYCEQQFTRVNGFAGIAEGMETIEAE